jgi:hypothetical protein
MCSLFKWNITVCSVCKLCNTCSDNWRVKPKKNSTFHNS